MKITLTNQARLSDVPPHLREILMEHLAFVNPKWLENQRMRRWNKDTPKIMRFYEELENGDIVIPRGYMRRLIILCRTHQVPYEMDDKRRMLPRRDFGFRGQLKAFQEEAVRMMLSRDFGTLNAPTGSGKTVMALYMIAQRGQPALVVVHTKELAYQWLERINTFLDIPEQEVGLIGDGKKSIGEHISVALVQTLYKCAAEVAEKTGFLIVDECHRIPSRTFTEAVTAFDSRYMMGLSATPWRRDRLSELIFWHLGDVHHEIDNAALAEKGHILRAEVIVRETEFIPFHDPVTDYSKMLSELTENEGRNHLIASDVAKESLRGDGIMLVLSDRKKHCESLRDILESVFGIRAELLTGDLSMNQRRDVMERLNQGEIRVLVATGQLVGEGLDCKGLSTLFIATPIRFSGRVLQYLGRILRPAPGKERARVFDYADVQVGPLNAAAIARQRVFEQLRRPDTDTEIS